MNYEFENMFIPKIIENTNKDDFEIDSVEVFDNFDFVRGSFHKFFPNEYNKFDWDSFSITKQMNSKTEYWLLNFPEPEKQPEAKWGLITHKKNKAYKYYTFELTNTGKYALCNTEKGTHLNMGIYDKETTVEEFINIVLEEKFLDF